MLLYLLLSGGRGGGLEVGVRAGGVPPAVHVFKCVQCGFDCEYEDLHGVLCRWLARGGG